MRASRPATVTPERVALAGLHRGLRTTFPTVAEWVAQSDRVARVDTAAAGLIHGHPDLASRDPLRRTTDSYQLVLGLGAEPDGLTSAHVRRIVADVEAGTDVVGITIAEFCAGTGRCRQDCVEGLDANC